MKADSGILQVRSENPDPVIPTNQNSSGREAKGQEAGDLVGEGHRKERAHLHL